MTEAGAVELICQRWIDQWPTLSSALPYALPNEPLPSAASFACVAIRHSLSEQITQGSPCRVERRGFVIVKLWAPAGAGASALATLCGYARSVFERQRLGTASEPVIIDTGATLNLGEDGAWTMATVSFPMRYRESQT